MKLILAGYRVPDDMVFLGPCSNPVSSYAYDRAQYTAEVQLLFDSRYMAVWMETGW